jgi:hypothetical protein
MDSNGRRGRHVFRTRSALSEVRGSIVAVVCGVTLATAVYLPFERVRVRPRPLPQVASDGSLVVSLPDTTALGEGPSAIILRLRGGADPARITIAVNSTAVDHVTIPASSEIRVDTAARIPPGTGHQLVLSANRRDWSLTYLELANIYGFSHRYVGFVIVPRDRHVPLPHWWLSVAVALALFALSRQAVPHGNRVFRWANHIVVVLVVALFAAAMLSPVVSRYRVLLSLDTFLVLAAILYFDPLVRVAARIMPTSASATGKASQVAPHVALVVLILSSVAKVYEPGTGFTPLIVFGSDFEGRALPALRATPHSVVEGSGYDGQFYAQLALDPMLRDPSIATALDGPAYRARRMLLPWTAHLLGLGNPFWVLQAYALLNVISWLALAWLLLRWLPPGGMRSTLAWMACLAGDGLLASVRMSLTDGPSMLLLAMSVAAIERNRHGIATALLGLAGLTRETNLVGAAILTPDKRLQKRTLLFTTIRAAAVAAPLFLWIVYVWSVGYSPTDVGASNFALPLTGFVDKWALTIRELANGSNPLARLSLFPLIALTTQAVFLIVHREWRNAWWRIGIAYLLLVAVLGGNVWGGHPSAISRIAIPIHITFNIILSRMRWTHFAPLWMLGNCNVLVGLDLLGLVRLLDA